MSIAVTGGTGFVGRALLAQAAAQGREVRALARRQQDEAPGVTWVLGDLSNAMALADMVAGVEAVIHVAGVTSASDPGQFDKGNVAGTMATVEAALAAGVPRFVFVSSLSAREPELSAYGRSKAKAETLVKASGLDWTIVRPPGIYGPGDASYFDMFRLARRGLIPVPPLAGRSSLIHVDDLCRLLLALVPGGEAVTHRVFEPDDGKPGGWPHYDLARAIGHAVGKRPRVLPLSKRTMEWAAKADGLVRGDKAQLTLDRVGYLTHPDWVVGQDGGVPQDLWRPRIETREGLRATAQWYREAGWM